jgi:hypothetical protein
MNRKKARKRQEKPKKLEKDEKTKNKSAKFEEDDKKYSRTNLQQLA